MPSKYKIIMEMASQTAKEPMNRLLPRKNLILFKQEWTLVQGNSIIAQRVKELRQSVSRQQFGESL